MRRDVVGYLFVTVAAASWSTSGAFIRWILADSKFTSLSLAFWRDLITFACLLVGLALIRPALLRIERRDLPWLIALGTIGIGIFHVLWNLSIMYIGYAAATILVYASPAFVTLMAWLLWREPLTRTKLLAILLALSGCVLVAGLEELAGTRLTASGLLLGLATAFAYACFSLFGRPVAQRYSPWTVLTYGFGFGALVLLPLQFVAQPPWPVPGTTGIWFAVLILVATIVPSGAYMAGLSRLPVSVASIMLASEVVFASILAFLLFGERLNAWQILGATLVVSGVVIVTVKGQES